MHVVVNRILGGLFRGLKQGADVHVKADIGEGGRDDLGPTVVPVLAHFDHKHTRAAAFVICEFIDGILDRSKAFVAFICSPVNPRECFNFSAVTSECVFHGHADFSYGCAVT